MNDKIKLFHGDCLELMPKFPDKSIDLILCDLPYGTTACSWDTIIPLDKLWLQYKRLIKPNHPIVLFATQPFTSILVVSNLPMFKYSWVWDKPRPGGFVNANLKPLKAHEDVCVFTDGAIANGAKPISPYFPQGLQRVDREWKRPSHGVSADKGIQYSRKSHPLQRTIKFTNYPRSIVRFDNPNRDLIHPTQKPLDFIKYLVETYSVEGALVLDNCMGSGTTPLACMQTQRKCIGIELKDDYFASATQRIQAAATKVSLF
jgi:site-specific DNA-methyltransferase (adenine-specific)